MPRRAEQDLDPEERERLRLERDRRRTRISNRIIAGLLVAAGLAYLAGEIFGI